MQADCPQAPVRGQSTTYHESVDQERITGDLEARRGQGHTSAFNLAIHLSHNDHAAKDVRRIRLDSRLCLARLLRGDQISSDNMVSCQGSIANMYPEASDNAIHVKAGVWEISGD